MNFTLLLVAFGLGGVIKCSQIRPNEVKIPLLKGGNDQYPMNHINVVLQSLYNACPLREAVFEKPIHQDTLESSAAFNPLQLIFAKMHYDMENRGEATQASIYFKDDYLRTASPSSADPNHFYTWITGNLFETSQKYRKLLQWELFDVKRTIETSSEVLIEDQFNILPVDINGRSLQEHLDNLFQHKREEIIVTVDGEGLKRTIETFKELSNSPTIASFLISPRPSEEELKIEESVFLPGDREYKLNSLIIYDPQEMKYSTCLRDTKNLWYRLEDDSFTPVSQESVLISASKFAVMLFYIDSGSSGSLDNPSPKPSQQLIVESLTKDTMHNISKTVQRQTSNSPPSKPQLSLPSKSKNMSANQLRSGVFFYGDSSPSTLRSSSTPLSLPTLPLTKTPPPDEFLTQLESILVPADLSRVKMNLITTEPPEQSIEAPSKSVPKPLKEKEDTKPRAASFDEVGLFTPTKKVNTDDDLELDYFEEVNQPHRPKSDSVWSQHYLTSHEGNREKHGNFEKHSELFSGLIDDFEFEFQESHVEYHSKSFDDQEHFNNTDTFEEEEEADLLLQASLAQIRKTREGGDLGSGRSKKQNKKSTKMQKAQSILANGLFYRSRAVLPLTTSSERITENAVESEEQEQQQQQKQGQKKKVNRYTKF